EEGEDLAHQPARRRGPQEGEADGASPPRAPRAGGRGAPGRASPRRDSRGGGRDVLARARALGEEPRGRARGARAPHGAGVEEARKRLLFMGRWQLPGRGDQARLGPETGGAGDGPKGAGGSAEGAGGPAGEGPQGGSPAGVAAGMSAIPARAAPGAAGSYRVETWGCQMNVLDGERMAGQLESLGFSHASDGAPADVVILNTC